MKYFKYRNISKVQQLAYKERLASLGKDEQKKIKRSDRLIMLLSIIGFVFFFCCIGMFIFFIKLIPVPKNIFLKILYGIGCAILGFIGLIISGLATGIPLGILLDKVRYNLPEMRKDFIKKASEPIRKYYGLSDEYLITKCFESTNTLFNNHDICIFRYGNEIRMTTDIVKGFINGNCDLGCYSIKFNELKIYKDDYNDKRATILEFNKEKFVIGISVTTAILGGDAEVPTIDGRVRITIEPGTQSGKVMRLRGKGLPDINGRGRGDIIVVVDVVIPTTLTKEERKLVEELSEQPNFKRAESHDKQDVFSRMKNFFR